MTLGLELGGGFQQNVCVCLSVNVKMCVSVSVRMFICLSVCRSFVGVCVSVCK